VERVEFELIPAIDLSEGKCVRLLRGRIEEKTIYSEDPAEVAREWCRQGASRLHVVDIDGALAGEPRSLSLLPAIRQASACPIEWGGGLRSLADIENALAQGADFVSLGTRALMEPDFLYQVVSRFGDKVVVGIDAQEGWVAVRGWTLTTDLPAVQAACQAEQQGCKRISYTDVARDGTLAGPNLEAIREVVEAVHIPVLASGGISSLDDLRRLRALAGQGLAGAVIGKALYEGRFTLSQAREVVRGAG